MNSPAPHSNIAGLNRGNLLVPRPPGQLPVFVALSRDGYPKVIPSYHRKMIRVKDDRADTLVQLYLSFFTLSRVIPLAKRLSADIIKPMVSPPDYSKLSKTLYY